MKQHGLRYLSCLILAMVFPAIAHAGGDDRPFLSGNVLEDKKALEAEGWRVLDPLNEVNSSNCIGIPITPLCAAETAEYCMDSADHRACKSVNMNVREIFGRRRPGAYLKRILTKYRVIEYGQVSNPAALTPKVRYKWRNTLRQGDTAIRIRIESCRPDEQCFRGTQADPNIPLGMNCRRLTQNYCTPLPPEDDAVYFLRQHGGKWIFVGMGYYGSLPPDAWKRK